MRWDRFGRSLLFGAFAGLAGSFFLLAAEPLIGIGPGLGLFSILIAAVYLVGLGNRPRRRLGAGLLALFLGGAVWLLGPTPREAILVAAALLSIGRTAICLPSRGARAWTIEALLTGGGLLIASAVLGSSPHSFALAVWAFFLVQSVFFLVASERRPDAETEVDPFDAAHARALAVMDSPL